MTQSPDTARSYRRRVAEAAVRAQNKPVAGLAMASLVYSYSVRCRDPMVAQYEGEGVMLGRHRAVRLNAVDDGRAGLLR